jgi:hypothetical protein
MYSSSAIVHSSLLVILGHVDYKDTGKEVQSKTSVFQLSCNRRIRNQTAISPREAV